MFRNLATFNQFDTEIPIVLTDNKVTRITTAIQLLLRNRQPYATPTHACAFDHLMTYEFYLATTKEDTVSTTVSTGLQAY